MKSFSIPVFYKSDLVGQIKEFRRKKDKLKKDFTPTLLDFGPVTLLLARHFGFCYGVENAVEIAYKTLDENQGKRIFLLSEMIHNPLVNEDLLARGIQFLQDTSGNTLIPWDELTPEDIVIVPAFGTTLEIERKLGELGINPYAYNTTCPFVEKVWNRASQIGNRGYTLVVHGKPNHEETRATFSHSQSHAPTVVVKDLKQAQRLALYMTHQLAPESFYTEFAGQYSENFEVGRDLQRIGVVNQTTMLASDTQGIADFLKRTLMEHHQLDEKQIEPYFANTRDTLCYATNDNQEATVGLLQEPADLALVIGGYNSSNTTHLVELCETKLPTYFIESADCLLSHHEISHFNIHTQQAERSYHYLPEMSDRPLRMMITCGASCPDSMVEEVIRRVLSFFPESKLENEVLETILAS